MKPQHETRRKIIREWMSLPKDKRQTEEQAKPFAKKAMERLPSSGDPCRQIMRWLLCDTARFERGPLGVKREADICSAANSIVIRSVRWRRQEAT